MQDAFRRLAEPGVDTASPLSLDTLMPGRPALFDKVSSSVSDMPENCTLCKSYSCF